MGLLTTVAASTADEYQFALEGSVFVAGAAVQWLRDEMGLIRSAAESEEMAAQVPDTNGCYVVPAFTGLGAPHWDQYARGTIVGITRGVNKNHIVRAALESIAYQTSDVVTAMEADSGIKLASLKVDGGASRNNFLMQFQSDVLNVDVERPASVETTALGAAYFAGLAVGYWDNLDDIIANRVVEKVFAPSMEDDVRMQKLRDWKKAVEHSFGWARD